MRRHGLNGSVGLSRLKACPMIKWSTGRESMRSKSKNIPDKPKCLAGVAKESGASNNLGGADGRRPWSAGTTARNRALASV